MGLRTHLGAQEKFRRACRLLNPYFLVFEPVDILLYRRSCRRPTVIFCIIVFCDEVPCGLVHEWKRPAGWCGVAQLWLLGGDNWSSTPLPSE